MILAAEYIPSPLQLMLVTRESGNPCFFETGPGGIGNRRGRPFPDSARIGKRGHGGRRAGGFLVCMIRGMIRGMLVRARRRAAPFIV
jgi:hypothetical protein